MAATGAIDFQAVFDSAPTPLMIMSPDLGIVDMNQAYLDAVGRDRDALVGRHVFDAFPANGETARSLRDSIFRVVRTGKPDFVPVLHYPIPVPDESGVVDRYWSVSHLPILGEHGETRFVLQNTQDVTDLHRAKADAAEKDDSGSASSAKAAPGGRAALGSSILARAQRVQALNDTLLAESAQLRNLFMSAPSFMCVFSGPDFRFELANSAFMSLVGQRELVGRPLREAVPEIVGQGYIELLEKVYRSGEPFVGRQMRIALERSPEQGLEEMYVNFVYQPILAEDGEVAGIFVDGNDVTDHVRAEKSQSLLVRELHHRVRNTLATVQGVMNSTARTAETIEEYTWAFSGRISSLARTHSLLTEEIQQFVSLPSLLRQEIGVYAEGADERVILEGPDVELPSQLAVPLGMTIHELSTNAYRHGALSTSEGHVTVTWTVVPAKEKRILTCRWIESGGPAVTPPERHGFGSMILTRVLSQQIGAKVDATYGTAGFELKAEIPLDIERA
ncbi:Histidine kinase [Beijerinckiaceae bacterium RH AL1]|nr:PAS domain-containing protein [Beijerinckiaceae bacterium]VVB49590.1 Histidine kinase [Beijerinckiaceae bacterium RH CH11]VVB49669.1 Histidine kinase [Beijerinckiaceae bacterium RH AL8]VVC56980.1 Histidine kinase [Beijerinckiaceae bacterium RH AL1]